jgi:hypothetical protein
MVGILPESINTFSIFFEISISMLFFGLTINLSVLSVTNA